MLQITIFSFLRLDRVARWQWNASSGVISKSSSRFQSICFQIHYFYMDLHHFTDICYVTLLFSLCICVCVFVFVYLCICVIVFSFCVLCILPAGGTEVRHHLIVTVAWTNTCYKLHFFLEHNKRKYNLYSPSKNPDTVAIWTNTWTTYRDYLLVPRLGKCRKQDSVYKWILILRFDCHRTDSLLTIDKIAIYYKDTKIIARLTMLKSTRKRKEMQEKWIIFDLFLRKLSHKVDGIFLRGTIGSIS